METEKNSNSIQENIFKKIQTGELNMRPKSYFAFKIGLLIFVTALTFLVSALLISYMLFSLHTDGHFFLLSFGLRGFFQFFLLFPWVLFIIVTCLLVFLDYLLKRFRFGYHRPIIYLFLGSLMVITVVGSLINLTSFHGSMLARAERRQLPVAGGLYVGLRKSHGNEGVFRGTVVSLATSTFIIKHEDFDVSMEDKEVRVVLPPNIRIDNLLAPGDEVFVAGDMVGDEIRAYGIHKITENIRQ